MAVYKIWDSLNDKIKEWEERGYDSDKIIYLIDEYEFYLAVIMKYSYKIFHNNELLYKKADSIMSDKNKYMTTSNLGENKRREGAYNYFNDFNLEKFNIKNIFSTRRKTRRLLFEYYKRYNEIILTLFGYRPNETFLSLFFFSFKRTKLFLSNPIFVLSKGYSDIGYNYEYADIFNLLAKKRDELINQIGIINPYLEKRKEELFKEFSQFKEDYDFFIEENESKKPYIVETKYWLIWTTSDGILAKYFKSLVPDGNNFKYSLIERIFKMSNIKEKAKKHNNDWSDFENSLNAFRKIRQKQPHDSLLNVNIKSSPV